MKNKRNQWGGGGDTHKSCEVLDSWNAGMRHERHLIWQSKKFFDYLLFAVSSLSSFIHNILFYLILHTLNFIIYWLLLIRIEREVCEFIIIDDINIHWGYDLV